MSVACFPPNNILKTTITPEFLPYSVGNKDRQYSDAADTDTGQTEYNKLQPFSQIYHGPVYLDDLLGLAKGREDAFTEHTSSICV